MSPYKEPCEPYEDKEMPESPRKKDVPGPVRDAVASAACGIGPLALLGAMLAAYDVVKGNAAALVFAIPLTVLFAACHYVIMRAWRYGVSG